MRRYAPVLAQPVHRHISDAKHAHSWGESIGEKNANCDYDSWIMDGAYSGTGKRCGGPGTLAH